MRETGTLKRFAKRRSCRRYVPEKGPDTMENILISACLLGVCCRYDGESKPIMQTVALMERYHLVLSVLSSWADCPRRASCRSGRAAPL